MHICFVAPEAWPVLSGNREIQVVGGAEMQQAHIARGLAAAGCRVSMLCLDYGQDARVEIDGITVHRLHRPTAGLPVLRFLHPRLTSFWRGMQKANADIYYQRSAGMLTGVVAAFCKRHRRKSVYAGAHNTDFQPGRQLIGLARDRWLYEYGLQRVHAIVAQNGAQVADCATHYARDATLIRSCYRLRHAPQMHDPQTILWVSTLRRFKRPELFLQLARMLPQFQFVMIGGPGGGDAASRDYYASIRLAASALPNVQFKGFVPPAEVERYFDQARVFVNTSDAEGFPNTFLQAWARNIPTISWFDTGARHAGRPVGEIVQDVDEAGRAIRSLMTEDGYWRQLGSQCRQYFTEFHSMQRVVGDYRKVFESLMRTEHVHESAT